MSDVASHFLQVVVVGTDGSEGANRAMAWTARLARSVGASVRAVHVLTYDRELFRDLSPDTMTNWRRNLEQELHRSWSAPLDDLGVAHRCALIEDDSPAAGLMGIAEREQADLIVVGASQGSGLAIRVLGSTGYSLTHRAHRPVVVVPAAWQPREPD
jgi:nucleotide-binding universal stress UspA family protein